MAGGNPPGLLFSDSELSRVVWQGPDLLLRFAAARWQPATAPATAATAAAAPPSPGATQLYLPGVELLLLGACTASALADCVGRLHAGDLRADGQPRRGPLAPGHLARPVQVQLVFANGAELQARASGLLLRLDASRTAREHLAC